MIITKKHADKLIRKGKASREPGTIATDRIDVYAVVITRHDLQRTDHYLVKVK